jgi:hypothetical protein
MSLKFLHQVIIFAAMSISLFFAAWCFTSPDVAGDPHYMIAGGVCIGIAIGLVFYEIHFLKRTRKLILH